MHIGVQFQQQCSRKLAVGPSSCRTLQIVRSKAFQDKGAVIDRMYEEFSQCMVVAAIDVQDMSLREYKAMRRSIEKPSKMRIAKRSLTTLAASKAGWPAVREFDKGQTAYVFIYEENLRESIQQLREIFEAEEALAPKDKQGNYTKEPRCKVLGAAMADGPLTEQELLSLEKMPTKLELLAKIMGQMKGASAKLPTLLRAVPTQLVAQLQAPGRTLVSQTGQLPDKSEDKSQLVRAFLKTL